MRFGLKSFLTAISLFCVLFYLLYAAPTVVATPALVFVWVGVAALVMAGLIYATGRLRAFCLGAMLPAGASIIALTWMLCIWLMAGPYEVKDWSKLLGHLGDLAFTMRVWTGGGLLLVVVGGLASMMARKAILRRGHDLSPGAADEERAKE